MYTNGGDPDAAYKIIKFFHRKYDNLKLIINGYCKSAGTLIALGADEILMGEDGELGPLDVQQGKNDELEELTSGLNIPIAIDNLARKALTTFRDYLLEIRDASNNQITTKTAAEIAVNLSTALYSKIFEKIDPYSLGETQRAINIAFKYASRIKKGNLKDYCVEKLIYDYPCHSFVIDYEEATTLFNIVKTFEKEEKEFFNILSLLIRDLGDKEWFCLSDGQQIFIANLREEYYDNEKIQNKHNGLSKPDK